MGSETVQVIRDRVLLRAGAYKDSTDEELGRLIDDEVCDYAREKYLSLPDKTAVKRLVFAGIRGFDVLQELIDDSEITEIMVNGPHNIFYEKAGRMYRYEYEFESEEKLSDVIQKIVAGANRSVNEAQPIADARLKDGSRVSVVLSPVSLCGGVITIRKFPKEVMTMERLISLGAISEEAALLLQRAVISGMNCFISGGTGSGKTTFLNALSGYIPKDERVITIEDSAELQLKGVENLVTLETRNANAEGRNAVTIRDLIKASLRLRPDRIVVGEVRDGACVDMLQALNTGHSGMSTGHANSTVDMLSRMETMVLLGGAEIPLPAVRRQIASAIDIIVHLGRFRDKSRKVVEITEVCGFQDGDIKLNPLFVFEEEGEEDGHIIGHLRSTGSEIIRTSKLKAAGLL